ncbi:MAG TPA: FAD-dependent oxidoreductase [Candidatus Nanoarchaeia archaeon]|nr:FAD-dependent oxidoreductase [Candidatus Nanoarchaeia archaeon]
MQTTAIIAQIVQETPTTKTFILQPQETLPFQPGQFIMVTTTIDNKPVTRAFSISSTPEEPLQITIKEEENGYFSKHANHQWTTGEQLTIKGPFGHFTLQEGEHHTFIAAGSGIAPIRSMIKTLLKENKTVHLYYSNKNNNDIIFHKEFQQLDHKNFHYTPIITRDQNHNGRKERITGKELVTPNTRYYICGPHIMVQDIKQQLHQENIPEDKINLEQYGN